MVTAAEPGAVVRLIRGATVIDGTGALPRPGTSVLIAGDRIAAIGPIRSSVNSRTPRCSTPAV